MTGKTSFIGQPVRFKHQDKTGVIVDILEGVNALYKIAVDYHNYTVWLPAQDFRLIEMGQC